MKKLHRRMDRFKGQTLGLDLHKAFIQWSLLDEHGDETANQRMASSAAELAKLVDRLTAGGQALQVVIEASGCFLWAYDLLADKLGKAQVHVAAPSKVRVIADSMEKNDANDAWWLAYLLYECRLPEAFVAEGDLRELRIASRELRTVVDQRSDLMRQMRSHLTLLGREFPKSAWSSKTGRLKVEQLVQDVSDQGMRGVLIARLWTRIQAMDDEVAYWSDQVKRLSAMFDEVALLARQLPGVGPVVAAAVWSAPGAGRPASLQERQGVREGDGSDAGLSRIRRQAEQEEDHASGQRPRALGIDTLDRGVPAVQAGAGRGGPAVDAEDGPASAEEGGVRGGGAEAGGRDMEAVRAG